MVRKKKSSRLTESEWYSSTLLVTPHEDGAAIFFCKKYETRPSVMITLYNAVCLLGIVDTIDEAIDASKQFDDGVRLPEDPRPARKWRARK